MTNKKFIFSFIILILTGSIYATTWDQLSLEQQNELIVDLEYASAPAGTKIIQLVGYGVEIDSVSIEKPYSGPYQNYINGMIKSFYREVSWEEIEQSEYQSYGDAEITGLWIITDETTQKIIGANMSVYQDGRDQDGEEADVNWSVQFHTNQELEPIEDIYYFEWSGH